MDKNKVAEELKKKGFDASGADGLVMIRYNSGTFEDTQKKAKKALQDMGYKASWGLILAKGSKSITDNAEAEGCAEEEAEPTLPDIEEPDDGEQLSFI